VRNLRWFEIVETRGKIQDNKLIYQVTLKVGFTLDESGSWAEEISLL
jgi:dodecin